MPEIPETTVNPYVRDGKPTILESYCAYYDLLGLKDLLKSTALEKMEFSLSLNARDANAQELLDIFYPILSGKSPLFSSNRVTAQIAKLQFSDNVVFGLPRLANNDLRLLWEIEQLLIQLSINQADLAERGVFIRGGLTSGPLYIDGNIAFGYALVEAVNMEEMEACNPRIVLSKALSNQIQSVIFRYPEYIQRFNLLLCKDPDNRTFINYLGIGQILGDNILTEILEQHKKNIEFNLKCFSSRPGIWSKYFWAANYHNYFIHSMVKDTNSADNKKQPNRLLIKFDSMAFKFRKYLTDP